MPAAGGAGGGASRARHGERNCRSRPEPESLGEKEACIHTHPYGLPCKSAQQMVHESAWKQTRRYGCVTFEALRRCAVLHLLCFLGSPAPTFLTPLCPAYTPYTPTLYPYPTGLTYHDAMAETGVYEQSIERLPADLQEQRSVSALLNFKLTRPCTFSHWLFREGTQPTPTTSPHFLPPPPLFY